MSLINNMYWLHMTHQHKNSIIQSYGYYITWYKPNDWINNKKFFFLKPKICRIFASTKSRPEKCNQTTKSRPEKCNQTTKSRPKKCKHTMYKRKIEQTLSYWKEKNHWWWDFFLTSASIVVKTQSTIYQIQKRGSNEPLLLGGVYRSRTDDLLHAMQAL